MFFPQGLLFPCPEGRRAPHISTTTVTRPLIPSTLTNLSMPLTRAILKRWLHFELRPRGFLANDEIQIGDVCGTDLILCLVPVARPHTDGFQRPMRSTPNGVFSQQPDMPVLCNWVMGTPSQPQGGCQRQVVASDENLPNSFLDPFGHLITRRLGVIRVILTSRKTLCGAASGLCGRTTHQVGLPAHHQKVATAWMGDGARAPPLALQRPPHTVCWPYSLSSAPARQATAPDIIDGVSLHRSVRAAGLGQI